MTKKEMAIVVEAIDGYVEVGSKISELYNGTPSFPAVLTDSPFGKLDKLLDLVYGYVLGNSKDNKVESEMFRVLLDDYMSVEEKIKVIEELREECKTKK